MTATPTPAGGSSAPARAHDRLLIALAAVALGISIAAAIAGEVLHVALPIVLVLVLAATGIALRVVLRIRARRAPTAANRRVLTIVSNVGLALSIAAAVASIAVLLTRTTPGKLLADVGMHLLTVVILLALTAPARTVGWRALLGMGLVGFLAIPPFALAVGTPVITALGAYDDLSVAVYAPITEEVLKALPVLLIVLVALRNPRWRPTAVDSTLLGLMIGTGFAVAENANFGRVLLGADTPLVVLYPSMSTDVSLWTTQIFTVPGHAVWTGIVAMGVGFGLLYRRRFRFSWIVIPVTLAIAIACVEHGLTNSSEPSGVLVVLTAGNALSPLLLTAGIIALTVFERGTPEGWSLLRDPSRLAALWRSGILLHPPVVAERSALAARRERADLSTSRAGR